MEIQDYSVQSGVDLKCIEEFKKKIGEILVIVKFETNEINKYKWNKNINMNI